MAKNRYKHVVDSVEQLLFESVGDISMQHVAFQSFIMLTVELRDLDRGSSGWGVCLDTMMWWSDVGEGAVHTHVFGERCP